MTAPDLINRHVEALLARLRSDAQLASSVFEGDVTGDPAWYVNVWHDSGAFESRTWLGEHVDVDITFTIHSVGKDRWQASWVDGRVLAAVNDHILTVAGRRCFRLAPSGTQPVTKDTTISPPKFLAVRRYVLHSIPAKVAP